MSGTGGGRPEAPAVMLENARAVVAGRTIWSGVELEVGTGEFAAVLGPNGAGKTTLLRVLTGELPLASGTAQLLGAPAGERRAEIGYLPQRRSLDGPARIRGIDLVRLGFDGMRWGLPLRRRGGAEVAEALEQTGAAGYAHRPFGELSGGEQQRLLIAQALVRRPRLLILDEPLDSLDLPNQVGVSALLAGLAKEQGVTVLLVAHDVNPMLPHLDRVVFFGAGRAAAGVPEEVIGTSTLSALYGAPVEVVRTASGRLLVAGAPDAPGHHGHSHGHGHEAYA